MAIHPSTATRQCDRLVAARLIRRAESHPDRRAITLHLTPAGKRVVEEVTARRRTAISDILANMTDRQRTGLVSALHAFAEAAGEIPPEQAWSLGWSS